MSRSSWIKIYGDADPVLTGTLTGFLAADGVTATYSRTAGESVAGSPYTISATLSPAGVLTNYMIAYNTADLTITKRSATWTTNANSKTYGDLDPAPLTTGSGSNFVDPVTATYSRAVGETVLGGPYHITATLSAGAGVLDNYIITNDGADFSITPKAASVTPNAATKTYGGADPTLTGTLAGFLAADGVTATYSRTAGETVLGSPYTISATLSPAGVLSNYNITYNTAAFTINPKAASVTPGPATKVYGSADPAFTGTLSGFLAADGVTATYSRTTGETVLGSPYTISATLSPASVLSNYSITYNTAAFTITPKAASVTANNASKTYGQTVTFAGTEFTTSGFINGDSVTSVTLTSAGAAATATVTAPGPDYSIVPSAAVGSGLSNYNISYVNGTLHISPKAASVTANNRSKTYGQTVTFAGTEFTTTGFVNGDNVTSVTLTSTGAAMTATVTAPGPDYGIVPSNAVGTGLGNYTIGYNNGTLHINTAGLTITANNRTKTFGATYTPDTTPPSVDFSVSGLLNSDSVTSITLTCAGYASGALPGSQYTITPSAAVATGLGNYTINYVTAQLTIGYGTCTGPNPGGVILPPINSDGTSVYKRQGGSTIPVKFTVCDANGNPISDPNAVFAGTGGALTMLSDVRGQVETINEVGGTDIPDVAFRFATDKWIFNMATNNLQSGHTYLFRINLKDGSGIQFRIGIK